ncbi:hypothetical protein [Vibrio tetraodonis]|nr:hypothetical protein [Vibrio tetraodonis]
MTKIRLLGLTGLALLAFSSPSALADNDDGGFYWKCYFNPVSCF